MAKDTPAEGPINSIYILEELYPRTTKENFYLVNPHRPRERVGSRFLLSEPLTQGVFSPVLGDWEFKWSTLSSMCALASLIVGFSEVDKTTPPKVFSLSLEQDKNDKNEVSSIFGLRQKPTVLAACKVKDDEKVGLRNLVAGHCPLPVEDSPNRPGWKVFECRVSDECEAQELVSYLLTVDKVFAIATSHLEGKKSGTRVQKKTQPPPVGMVFRRAKSRWQSRAVP